MLHTKDTIRPLLERSDAAVEKGLTVIYSRQTEDEQSNGETRHTNGRGFSGADAAFLSSLAVQVNKHLASGQVLGRCLSAKQMVYARKKMLKYAGQLAEVANEKAMVQTA